METKFRPSAPLLFSLLAPLPIALALILVGCSGANAQSSKGPDVGDFERALEHKLQKLIPDGMTERDVRFLDVVAGTGAQFRATLVIRDYGAGYPKNKYYGQTCVGKLDEVTYALTPDAFGGWDVQGRMTPDLSKTTCTQNPSEGASSQPAAGLPGTPAPAKSASAAGPSGSAPRQAAPAASANGFANGAYLCWANGEARGFMNFSVTSASTYVGSDNKTGRIALDPSNNHVTFTGGSMAGAMPDGFYTIYHIVQNVPTFSIMSSTSGAEAVFCQHK